MINNQLTRQFRNLHRDWIEFRYQDNEFAARREVERIRDRQRDILNGGAWFNRWWWDSLPEEKGGAPKLPVIIYRGPSRNIIDFGVAYITPDFRFKWREYEVNLTKVLSPSSDEFIPSRAWNFRFRPNVKFSTRTLLRSASLIFIFEYSEHGVKLIQIQVYVNYSVRLTAIHTGISFSLLQW